MDWSDKWSKNEKDITRRFQYDSTPCSGSYPYLPTKVTIVILAIAIVMGVGMINGIMNPAPRTLPTADEIEEMSCSELHEFLEKNIGNLKVGMSYWVDASMKKFLDECSSYG